MADFTLWVTACETALGWQRGRFAKDFTEARGEMVSASLEAEPIVGPLRKLARAGDWEGTASELLEMLVEVCGLNDAKRLPGG